jgi:Tol biopolymer transport system component
LSLTQEANFRALLKDTNDYRTLTLSADGKTLATVQQKGMQTLYLMPAAGFTGVPPRAARAQSKDAAMFGWTSNGDLYFGNASDLLRISADGKNRVTLFSERDAQIIRPSGCRDGRYIVFVWANHAGNKKVDIGRIDSDGSNPKQLTSGSTDVGPTCSPDGKLVYYENMDTFQLLRVSMDGGTPEVVPGSAMPSGLLASTPIGLSPDGKLLAFFASSSDPKLPVGKIVLLPLDAGPKPHPQFIYPDARFSGHVQFTPDGKAIVYGIRENGAENLWLHPLDGSPGHQITTFPADAIQTFRFSLDGKSLGVMRTHVESDIVLLHDDGLSAQ